MNRASPAPPAAREDGPLVERPLTLSARMQRGPLPLLEVTAIIGDVFAEVAAIHAAERIDGELSAERIVVDAGRARLTAKITPARRSPADAPSTTRDVDVAMARFAFMAPEEVRRSPVDGRADTYALGALAFAALTGKLPFQSADALRLVAQKLALPPPTLASATGRAFPPLLELFVATSMSTDRERRYPNIRVAHAAWRIACAA